MRQSTAIFLLHIFACLSLFFLQLGATHLLFRALYLFCWTRFDYLSYWSFFLSSYGLSCFFRFHIDMGHRGFKLTQVQELLASVDKKGFQVLSRFRWYFSDMWTYVFQFFLCLFRGYCPLFSLINLVADDENADVLSSVLFDVVEPHVDVVKGIRIGNVIY